MRARHDARQIPSVETANPSAQCLGDLSFEALMDDDLVKLVMASDHVSEGELKALMGVRPLIDKEVADLAR